MFQFVNARELFATMKNRKISTNNQENNFFQLPSGSYTPRQV
jgi:hypothetical protein